jgi:hypothetical protein
VRRPEAVDAARLQRAGGGDLVEELVRVREEVARDLALLGVVEDRRIPALELPGVEEERPVHVFAQRGDLLLDEPGSRERRRGEILRVPLDRRAARPRLPERQHRLAPLLRVEGAEPILLDPVFRVQPRPPVAVQQVGDDADNA